MKLVEIFFIITCVIIYVILLVSWVLGIVFQFLMMKNRKKKVKLFEHRILFNPFNLQFFGKKYLTEKGIYWRNKSWIFFSIFVITIIVILSLKELGWNAF